MCTQIYVFAFLTKALKNLYSMNLIDINFTESSANFAIQTEEH